MGEEEREREREGGVDQEIEELVLSFVCKIDKEQGSPQKEESVSCLRCNVQCSNPSHEGLGGINGRCVGCVKEAGVEERGAREGEMASTLDSDNLKS